MSHSEPQTAAQAAAAAQAQRLQQAPTSLETIRALYQLFKGPLKHRLNRGIALVLLSSVLQFAALLSIAVLVREVAIGVRPAWGQPWISPLWALLLAAGFTLVQHGLYHAGSYQAHRATFACLRQLYLRCLEKLDRLPLGYVYETPLGKLQERFIKKVKTLEDFMAHGFPEFPAALTVIFGSALLLLIIDWAVFLALIGIILLALLSFSIVFKGYSEKMGGYLDAQTKMEARTVEYVLGIPVIKAFAREQSSYEQFLEAASTLHRRVMAWWKQSWLGYALFLSFFSVPYLLVLPVSLIRWQSGHLSPIGLLLALVLPFSLLYQAFTVMMSLEVIQLVRLVWADLKAFLEMPEQNRHGQVQTLDLNQGFEFDQVSFGYKADQTVLEGIQLKIPLGKKVAFVGPSGSGKSTLLKLMAGFWDPTAGEIRFGGVPLTELDPKLHLEQISYVAQDTFLFDDNLANNIRLGRPTATDDEVYEAAQLAQCDPFIQKLTSGYQTPAGEAGKKLSGGERQRLTLARAILKRAPFVLLDEATAYADPENQALIQSALETLVKGKTLILVAHRLQTVVNMDEIYVIDQGKICAHGTHDELLSSCPLYQTLWKNDEGRESEVA